MLSRSCSPRPRKYPFADVRRLRRIVDRVLLRAISAASLTTRNFEVSVIGACAMPSRIWPGPHPEVGPLVSATKRLILSSLIGGLGRFPRGDNHEEQGTVSGASLWRAVALTGLRPRPDTARRSVGARCHPSQSRWQYRALPGLPYRFAHCRARPSRGSWPNLGRSNASEAVSDLPRSGNAIRNSERTPYKRDAFQRIVRTALSLACAAAAAEFDRKSRFCRHGCPMHFSGGR